MKPFSPHYDKFTISYIARKDFLDSLNKFLNEEGLDIEMFSELFKKLFSCGISNSTVSISRSLLQGNMTLHNLSPTNKSKILEAFDDAINFSFCGKRLKRRMCSIF